MTTLGSDRGHGNLIGAQPFMPNAAYASAERFRAAVEESFVAAHRLGWLNPKTIIVFPEYFGAWLVALGEPSSVLHAATLEAAMRRVVGRHPVRFLRDYLRSREPDRARAALFRMKATQIAHVFHETFSRLAREYAVTVAPGSLVLPRPCVRDGRLSCGDGPLQNVTGLYRPDGSLDERLVRKVHLIEEERGFCDGGAVEELPVYETPAGRLALLICADSWFPNAYAALAPQRPDFVAVPSFTEGGKMGAPWGGYDPPDLAPPDVSPEDAGRIRHSEAWAKYALAGRLASCGARAGLIANLQGDFWGMGGDGGGTLLRDGEVLHGQTIGRSSLINVWL